MKGERIGIVGAGNMGEALLRGIMQSGFPRGRLIAGDRDKKRRDYLRKKYHISVTADNLKVVAPSSVVILAVKPQDIETVLAEISGQRATIRHRPLFISIAAGISTKYIESFFKRSALRVRSAYPNGHRYPIGHRLRVGKVRVVRVMPSAPALIGKGISAISLGRYAKAEDYRKAEGLFKAVGEVVRIEEGLIDKVTAISGSGPAYFFLLIKCLTDSAIRLGLNRRVAERLVNHTAQGSAEMIIKTKQSPQVLIAKVASKGGTTEAALEVFAKQEWGRIIDRAVKAAVRRAKKLRRN